MSFSRAKGRKRADLAPTTMRALPVAISSQATRRLGGETPECHSAGAAPKRDVNRSITAWVSAISGNRISAWASESSASAWAAASR